MEGDTDLMEKSIDGGGGRFVGGIEYEQIANFLLVLDSSLLTV